MKEEENMSYNERLKCYEEEKRLLRKTNLNGKEYEKAVKKLADKWKI